MGYQEFIGSLYVLPRAGESLRTKFGVKRGIAKIKASNQELNQEFGIKKLFAWCIQLHVL